MIITHHGNQFFKLQVGDTVIAINPISKESKLKTSKFGANIALISLNHPDFNGAEQVSFGEKQAFVISGPGEYETKGIFIKGFLSVSRYAENSNSSNSKESQEKINTIYTFNFDNINVCFLGALDSASISNETKEAIDDVDMLFVPIGGNGVLNAQDAYKLAVQFEPKVIIPIGVDTGNKDALKTFLKEGGGEDVKPIDKLTVKKKDLEGKEGDIIVVSVS